VTVICFAFQCIIDTYLAFVEVFLFFRINLRCEWNDLLKKCFSFFHKHSKHSNTCFAIALSDMIFRFAIEDIEANTYFIVKELQYLFNYRFIHDHIMRSILKVFIETYFLFYQAFL
jgi:hypothetical protein